MREIAKDYKGNPGGLEIRDVAGHYGHAMNEGGGSDERIALPAPVWNVQLGAALRDGSVDGQDTSGEFG